MTDHLPSSSITEGAAPPETDADPFPSDLVDDPYPIFAALRNAGPAVRLTKYPIWAITRYDELRAAMSNWQVFSSAKGVGMTDEMNALMRGTVLASDPPEHDALRRVLRDQLAPRGLAGLLTEITERAEAIVAKAVDKHEVDAVADLAEQLPVDVVADLIGLPPDGRENLLSGAQTVFAAFGPLDERMTSMMPDLMDYYSYMQSFDSRDKLTPGSWGHRIFDAVDDGRIAPESATPLLMAYLSAGMDTTVHSLGAYVRFLADHVELLPMLKA